MTQITVTRNSQGKITGLGEKDKRAFARLSRRLADLEPGECLMLDVWFDRNPKLHRYHFVALSAVYDAQEQFGDPDDFRLYVQVGAGWCYYVPGPGGKMCAIPKSISYSAIDDAEFEEHHQKCLAFLRSQRCTRFLWPAMSDQAAGELVHELLERFR